jgi:hypothetical protein
MAIPLETQALVYWKICQELRQAREAGNSVAEAEASYELADLDVFTGKNWGARMYRPTLTEDTLTADSLWLGRSSSET